MAILGFALVPALGWIRRSVPSLGKEIPRGSSGIWRLPSTCGAICLPPSDDPNLNVDCVPEQHAELPEAMNAAASAYKLWEFICLFLVN
jgi:hypothetical protein